MRTSRILGLLIGLALVAALVLAPALIAGAVGDAQVVAQENPYQPPDFDTVDTPGWLRPLEPLAALPLWGQAAVLSAGVAGLILVVPMIGRWVWKLGEGRHEGEEDVPEL